MCCGGVDGHGEIVESRLLSDQMSIDRRCFVAKCLHSFLFGDYRIARATSGRGRYGHTFGGPHDRKGTTRAECNGLLIHLLHRFDLTDPVIPISIPGIRWLPLYYCFDFRADELGYRLTSDEALVTFFPVNDPNVTEREEWPDDDYALEFPRSDITVTAFDYDPTNLDDAYFWAGIFGIGQLSAADQAAAKQRVAEEFDGLGLYSPETDEEYHEALSSPFSQGKPVGGCLNPDCSNSGREGRLSTIALLPAEPVKGVQTFGSLGGGVQLVFQICGECKTIRVSNQCD